MLALGANEISRSSIEANEVLLVHVSPARENKSILPHRVLAWILAPLLVGQNSKGGIA